MITLENVSYVVDLLDVACLTKLSESSRSVSVTRRTETDSKGERRRVCLFFLPFVYFDNSELRRSLSLSLFVLSM